jgi:hypothetical protein
MPPEPTVEGAVSTGTTIRWVPAEGAVAYIVRWRRTDASQWQHAMRVTEINLRVQEPRQGRPGSMTQQVVLPGVRVDDWVFGVSALAADGSESPVAAAVPGGAFKPYTPPPPPPAQ